MNLDPNVMMNATFLKRIPKQGNIALVSQSELTWWSMQSAEDVGFSAVVSMGKQNGPKRG